MRRYSSAFQDRNCEIMSAEPLIDYLNCVNKKQKNKTKQNPPCKFWIFSHSECRLTMAVKPHSEQDKEISHMKGRARHKQKGLQFTKFLLQKKQYYATVH